MKFYVGQRVRIVSCSDQTPDTLAMVGRAATVLCALREHAHVRGRMIHELAIDGSPDTDWVFSPDELEPLRDNDFREIEAWAQRRTRDLVSKLTGYVPGESVHG